MAIPVSLRREPIDLVLVAVCLGSGPALLRPSRSGRGALAAARIVGCLGGALPAFAATRLPLASAIRGNG